MFRWQNSLIVGLTVALAVLVSTPQSADAGGPKSENPFAGTWYWGTSGGWVDVSKGGQITGELYYDEYPRVVYVSGRINRDGAFAMEFVYHSGDGGVTGRSKPFILLAERFGWAEFDSTGNVVGVFYSDEGLPTGMFLWIPQ